MKIEIGGFGLLLIIVLLYLMYTNVITPMDALFYGAIFFILIPLAIVVLIFSIMIFCMIIAVILGALF